jgi:hypothetical protein
MKPLAKLSDKYIIEHLHQDICVLIINTQAYKQTLTSSLIVAKYPPSVDLWQFAVQHEFPELEAYCLENKPIYEGLLKILANPDQGIAYFAKMGISVSKLNLLVTRVAAAALDKSCYFCLAPASPTPRSPTGTSANPMNSPRAVSAM